MLNSSFVIRKTTGHFSIQYQPVATASKGSESNGAAPITPEYTRHVWSFRAAQQALTLNIQLQGPPYIYTTAVVWPAKKEMASGAKLTRFLTTRIALRRLIFPHYIKYDWFVPKTEECL